MDPITHSLIGAVSAKGVKAPKRRFLIMTLMGMAPDIDVVMNVFGSWAVLFQHRGITHSLLGLAIQAIFYGYVFGKWDSGRFDQRVFHYSLPLGLHLFSDYLTSYGVPLLLPFSRASFSWDLAGSLNFFPIAFTVAALWWLQRKKMSGWRAVAPVCAIWAFYFVVVASGRSYAARLASSPGSQVTAIPSISSPLLWRAVAVDNQNKGYRHYNVDILTGHVTYLGSSLQPGNDFPVQKSLNSPLVQEFMKNNRWPTVRVSETARGWRVEWGSIIYSVRGMVRGKVAVAVDKDGHVVHEESVVSFWDPQLS
jgi:membrane-bound metal-dependent hydrolase YbcI (DUF457 family)